MGQIPSSQILRYGGGEQLRDSRDGFSKKGNGTMERRTDGQTYRDVAKKKNLRGPRYFHRASKNLSFELFQGILSSKLQNLRYWMGFVTCV